MLAGMAEAVTRYTGPGGHDTNNDCTEAQNISTPKLTINAGIGCLFAGDTLIVRPGVYAEILNPDTNGFRSGTDGNPITVRSEVQYGAIIRPNANQESLKMDTVGIVSWRNQSYIVFDGFVVDAINLTGAYLVFVQGTGHHITITNNELKNGQEPDFITTSNTSIGVYLHGYSHHITVSRNKIHDMGLNSAGPWSYAMYWRGSDSIAEYNEMWSSSGWAIHMYSNPDQGYPTVDRNIVRNNIIRDNGAIGLQMSVGFNNAAYNNIFYRNGWRLNGDHYPALLIGGWGGAAGNDVVYNNTFWNNTRECISVGIAEGSGATNNTVRNNICWQNGSNDVYVKSTGTGNVTSNHTKTDPLFVNTGIGNFQLRAGSPAIDAGMDLSSTFTIDFAGNTRTAPWETGAYMFGGAPIEPILLAFTVPPAMTTVNQVMVPSVKVCAVDSLGVPQTTFANTITLTLTTGTGVLTGGTATAPVTGCSTFAGLSISTDGVKRLTAAATGATSIVSNDFTINAAAIVGAPELLRLLYMP